MQSFYCKKCKKDFNLFVMPSLRSGHYLATCPVCGSRKILDTDTAISTANDMVGLFYPPYWNDFMEKINQLGD